MSWITQTIDFYRSVSNYKKPGVTSVRQSATPADLPESAIEEMEQHESWLNEFENTLHEQSDKEMTPKQHGDRLLRLTKARALRRLLKRNNLEHDSAA